MNVGRAIVTCIVGLNLALSWSKAEQPKSLIQTNQVESYQKAIIATSSGMAAKGRWKKTAGDMQGQGLPRINTTWITCDKVSMTCREIGAQLITPQDNPVFEKPQLLPYQTDYVIVAWSDDVVSAKCEGPCGDIELRISLKDSFAERRVRETKARGCKDADPKNYEVLVLE
jgi:hypothetical protein